MEVLLPLFIGVVFVVIIGTIVFTVSKGIAEWADNNSKPILAERARIVSKRSETSGNMGSSSSGTVSTWYYVTFELPSGDRQEFVMGGAEYGKLAEGDVGELVYQGTRYHRFERQRV